MAAWLSAQLRIAGDRQRARSFRHLRPRPVKKFVDCHDKVKRVTPITSFRPRVLVNSTVSGKVRAASCWREKRTF